MDLIDIARDFLEMVSSELDPHTSKKGFIKQEGPAKITLFTPAHIQFAKYGRGPGKRPPLEPILEWVKEKGIVSNEEARGTAFAIMNSIGKKGTKNWKPGAPNAMDEAITKHEAEYIRKSSALMTTTVNNMIMDEYRKLFPTTTEFKI